MATTITTENLLSTWWSNITTQASSAAGTDMAILYKTASGEVTKITLDLLKSYLVNDLISVDADAGTITIGGDDGGTIKLTEYYKFKYLTEDAYDTLVEKGEVDADTTYFLYEDE